MHAGTSPTPAPGSPRTGRPTARLRAAALGVLVALSAVVLAGCGGTEVAAQMTSSPRPEEPRSELAPDEPAPGELPDLDEIPGMEDLEDQFDDLTEGLGAAGECATLAFEFASLAVVPFTSDDATDQITDVLDEVRERLPNDLQDDLDLVSDTLLGVSDGDLSDVAGALSDPEFTEAYTTIAEWIATDCV